MSQNRQLAVVTGASSGIGRATAVLLAKQGFHVLAGVRRAEDAAELRTDGVEPVILDVTDTEQVREVAALVGDDPEDRPIGVLVNNAGIAVSAPVEMIPMQEWRRQFEVNFFGQVAMIQALLPALLRAQGRIVNVSSIGGRVVGPMFGAYGGSKFALEAMSDALRREVGRLGVKVVLIEPGTVATPIWGKGLDTSHGLTEAASGEQRARYDDLVAAARKQAEALERNGISPHEVAKVILEAVESPRPRPRYLAGRDAKIMATLARYLPDRTLDRLIAGNLRTGGHALDE